MLPILLPIPKARLQRTMADDCDEDPRERSAALGEQRKRTGNLPAPRSLFSPANTRFEGEQPFSSAFGNEQEAPKAGLRG
jgi:hypothetical protein